MKTYDEMAQSALTRGKAIRKKQEKRNKIIVGTLSGLAVCCLAILLIWGFNNGNGRNGPTNLLSVIHKTDIGISGQAFQYIAGAKDPADVEFATVEPKFEFKLGYIHVVARAVEEYTGIYETLSTYGGTLTDGTYRLFRMEVIDPLESGMEGTFYYLLPSRLKSGDLTQYDALLISMRQLPRNYVVRNNNQLSAVEYLFMDPSPVPTPELGNILPFTDGVFDPSLWEGKEWEYAYHRFEKGLSYGDEALLVAPGSTLKTALKRLDKQLDQWENWVQLDRVEHYDFQTEEARQALEYVKPFENGIFVPLWRSPNYQSSAPEYRRYINGCPTNEWISIDLQDESVRKSEYSFEDEDFENLPDISAYIANLDLSRFSPQHMDTDGKTMIFNSVVGWYEKTETGVYSVVQIRWRYFDTADDSIGYLDETFILLEETGGRIVSREELIRLIGNNSNIYTGEYGVGYEILKLYF